MIPLKQFVAEGAQKTGLTWSGYYYRLKRAGFSGLKITRKNSRVVFVQKGLRT